MNSRYSADVNKYVRLDTVFRTTTATGTLNSREVQQAHTNLSARCCSTIQTNCFDPISQLVSNANHGIKLLALRTALSIYPTPARAIAISRQSLQRSSEHVHSLIENLQTLGTDNKDDLIEAIDRAQTAAAPLMKYGEINFDEILRARIGTMPLEQKQSSNALLGAQKMLGNKDLSDELRFNLQVISEALTSLKQRPALVLSSAKVLLGRSLINDDKCLASLKEFLQSTNPPSAEKKFSILEKKIQNLLLNAKYFEKTETFLEGLPVKINQQNISMSFIKEMMCKHSLSLFIQSSEKTNPLQQLRLKLSYLSQLKRQELAQADYKVESVSATQLRALSHVNGQKITQEQLKKLGPVLEKIISLNHQDRMKDMRKNVVTKYQVLSLIDESAKVIDSSVSIFKTISVSTSSLKIKPTYDQFKDRKALVYKNAYTVIVHQNLKKEIKAARVVRWNTELPKEIPQIISSVEELKKIIDYKKLLRENAIYDLHPMLESFAKSVKSQDATNRFEDIEKAALRFVQKHSSLGTNKFSISESFRKSIFQEYRHIRDSLIKDMLIIVFPAQVKEAKRIIPVIERSTEHILPNIGRALSLLPAKKIDTLIDAERGYLLISQKERADVHRISHRVRLENKLQDYFTHPELDLFDEHFGDSVNDLADFLANIDGPA